MDLQCGKELDEAIQVPVNNPNAMPTSVKGASDTVEGFVHFTPRRFILVAHFSHPEYHEAHRALAKKSLTIKNPSPQ